MWALRSVCNKTKPKNLKDEKENAERETEIVIAEGNTSHVGIIIIRMRRIVFIEQWRAVAHHHQTANKHSRRNSADQGNSARTKEVYKSMTGDCAGCKRVWISMRRTCMENI